MTEQQFVQQLLIPQNAIHQSLPLFQVKQMESLGVANNAVGQTDSSAAEALL